MERQWQHRMCNPWGGFTLDVWATGEDEAELITNRERAKTALYHQLAPFDPTDPPQLSPAEALACALALGVVESESALEGGGKVELIKKLGVIAREVPRGGG